jgi:hypothetical protein
MHRSVDVEETGMTPFISQLPIAAIAVLIWSSTTYSQPAGDKPKIVVGDQWEFASTSAPSGKLDTWSRTVVEVPSEDRLRVRFGAGTLGDYDGAMDWMPQGNPDFRRQLVSYPLAVGKEWPVSRKFENPNTSETGKAKVVAIEQITVPAGTYQCYKIDAEASLVNKMYTERRFWSRWYCPEIKWIAKEIVETRIFNPGNPASTGTTIATSELVRFTPGTQ